MTALKKHHKKIPGLYVTGVTAKEAIRTFSPPPPPPVAEEIARPRVSEAGFGRGGYNAASSCGNLLSEIFTK